jgi:hypothetical protein
VKTQDWDNSSRTVALTRRGFVKTGGALFVSLYVPGRLSATESETQTSPDPSQLASWLEIRDDNTILVRTLMELSPPQASALPMVNSSGATNWT